jgi:hypothetical protein
MEYLSLYDYLGKAAGSELGKQVAAAAIGADIKVEKRDVENPKYTGKVLLYPKDFLDFYFREPDTFEFEPTLGDRQDYDDDLPF